MASLEDRKYDMCCTVIRVIPLWEFQIRLSILCIMILYRWRWKERNIVVLIGWEVREYIHNFIGVLQGLMISVGLVIWWPKVQGLLASLGFYPVPMLRDTALICLSIPFSVCLYVQTSGSKFFLSTGQNAMKLYTCILYDNLLIHFILFSWLNGLHANFFYIHAKVIIEQSTQISTG